MTYAIGAIVVVLVLVELHFWASLRGRFSEKKLRKLCRGDDAQMSRLIAHEQQRNRKLSRKKAIKAAIQSVRRDSR